MSNGWGDEHIHEYRVFGLKVRSPIELPELFADDTDEKPDIEITLGSIDAMIREGGLQVVEDGALVLVVPNVASYRIEEGRKVIVDPANGVPPRNVRLFLLGSAFGALLHQRGLLPLHANAVEVRGRAVAFMGPSGAGKSTLAAWFHDQGHTVLADDVSVVSWSHAGAPLISSGLPRLRLWAEALEHTGRDAADYDRSYIAGLESLDKFDVPIKSSGPPPSFLEIGALYLLERGDDFAISELTGLEAAEAVMANTYRGSYLAALKAQQNHWEFAVKLVRASPVYRVTRRWDLATLNDQSRRCRDHALDLPGPTDELG